MSVNDPARQMMDAAARDVLALQAMGNAAIFADEVFGFHAQQAVEKYLKAWLASKGREYPLTHDIRALLAELKADGEDVEPFWDLVELNAFAVQFRYESHDPAEDPLDRAGTVRKITALKEKLESLAG